jgi:hypothetical protein
VGNAAIIWTPSGATSARVLDLGEPLSDLFWTPEREAADGVTIVGSTSRALGLGRLRITASLDRMAGGRDLAFQLRTVQSHLERGGRIGLTADIDKAFAAFASAAPRNGDPRLDWSFQPWAAEVGGVKSLTTGDYLAIQTASPEAFRAWIRVGTFSTSGRYLTIAGGAGVPGTPAASPVLVRWAYYFPSLSMPEDRLGQQIVSGEHESLHSLDLELVEDWGALSTSADAGRSGSGLGWAAESGGAYLTNQDGSRFVPFQATRPAWDDLA